MRILVVHTPDVSRFPPVRSLTAALLDAGHQVTLLTKDESASFDLRHPRLRLIRIHPPRRATAAGELLLHSGFQRRLRETVEREMRGCDLLWTTTDTTVRELGELVLHYPHVMQLLELVRDIPRTPGPLAPGLGLERFARAAWRVVVPEENRAHIQRLWWKLDRLPTVLPNKPYPFPPPGEPPAALVPVLREMSRDARRIVLYQGTFYEDRDLTPIARALEGQQDRYCMVVMGRDNPSRAELCARFPGIRYIPFVAPPAHLFVTKYAHIGLLPYTPCEIEHYSELNALFCAPNKLYEYAGWGVPMLGSRVPGLSAPMERWRMGIACELGAPGAVQTALAQIEEDYPAMRSGCLDFFRQLDLVRILNEEILGD